MGVMKMKSSLVTCCKNTEFVRRNTKIVDSEIHKLVDMGIKPQQKLSNIKELEIIVEGLLEYDLSGDEILDRLKGKSPDRPDTDGEEPPSDPTAVPTESKKKHR